MYEYEKHMYVNIEIVHKKEDELEKLYYIADISVIFVKPNKYSSFAVPFKLFEAIGYGKLLIISADTYCGDLVDKSRIRLKVPYRDKYLRDLLYKTMNNPKELESKKKQSS
ncbi:MAG: hypothetical protein QXI49_07430 [Candidatus Methanomethylicaceae archaeon]